MGGQQLTIPGRLDRIEAVCDLVGKAAEDAGFDGRTAYACQLAVAEACENIILHGYQAEGAGDIRVTTHSKPGELTVELHDSAPPFDPASPPEERAWTMEYPPVGGLGLLIIHRVMDEIDYRRRGKHNALRLVKRKREAGRQRGD
jgi:anti-sigma regulatory factor (Ser/Thr protein kinase)